MQDLKNKFPPFDDDAEKAVLGAILLSPSRFPDVTNFLRVDDFYRTGNQLIYQAMLDIDSAGGRQIDLITLTEALKASGNLEKSGGLAYIAALTDMVPTAANVTYYAQLVQDRSFRRAILQTADIMVKNARDESLDARGLVETAEQQLFILANKQNIAQVKPIKTIVPHVVQKVQAMFSSKGDFSGVPSGFTELDSLTQGFQNQDYIIIGARPSMGKTAFALSIAVNIAIKYQIPLGFFSLEMSEEQLGMRLISQVAKIESDRLRKGTLTSADFTKLTEAAGRLYEAPLYIDDTPNIRLLDLRTNARRMIKEFGVKIIFIDYLGLITSERMANVPRHEQVSEISRSLKQLARELNVPLVCLSQVGREAEGEEPKLSDLRDSGSIEQDADIVMFLHRKRDTDPKEENANPSDGIETKLLLAKHRNGPTDRLKLNFIKRYALFTEISKDRG